MCKVSPFGYYKIHLSSPGSACFAQQSLRPIPQQKLLFGYLGALLARAWLRVVNLYTTVSNGPQEPPYRSHGLG